MGYFSELWDMVKGDMNDNKASYQTNGIAFEAAVEYNFYDRKFDTMYR